MTHVERITPIVRLNTLKALMLKSSLCEYIDAYIHVKWTITPPNTGASAASNNRKKEVISKSYAPSTDCIRQVNNTQINVYV